MKIITNPGHEQHEPEAECFRQKMLPYREAPERLQAIAGALRNCPDMAFLPPRAPDMKLIERVHGRAYLDYLRAVSAQAATTNDYRVPYVLATATPRVLPTQCFDQVAYYAMDTTTPIGPATWAVAVQSAMAAATGAELLLRGARAAYALCRPPGHHAERARYGGYCFINNAAVAAEMLAAQGKVAILDVDSHHGNGTQSIFYERADVLYVSLHADPVYAYPFCSGYAAETGRGPGLGFNLNLPLPCAAGDDEYLVALDRAGAEIAGFAPATLILSLGYDAHEEDPVGALRLTAAAYRAIGKRVADLKLPLLIVQEGGYNGQMLGDLTRLLVAGLRAGGIK